MSVLRIEVGDLAKYIEGVLRGARSIMSFNYGEIVSPGFNDQILLGIKIREVRGNLDIIRLKAIDFLVHCDRFEPETLFLIVLGDATKTTHRLGWVTDAGVEVPQHVERREIIRIDGNYLAIFFYGERYFTELEVFLGGTQSLYLVKSHFEFYGLEQIKNGVRLSLLSVI